MPLTTIYITRHGVSFSPNLPTASPHSSTFLHKPKAPPAPSILQADRPYLQHRSNWLVNPQTGIYTSSYPTPTNNPADPALSSHGVKQSHELARHLVTLQPSPFKGVRRKDGKGDTEKGWVYCSPYYRCLQTLAPTIELLGETEKETTFTKAAVRGETGIGEWYGTAPFSHPSPSPVPLLRTFFPFLSPTYTPHTTPSVHGESTAELHDRIALALATVISDVDAEIAAAISDVEKDTEYALLICSHAAPIIAMGRALTGHMPAEVSEEDFYPFTCGLSKFTRRTTSSSFIKSTPDWQNGKGLGGGWDCVLNGDCSFLSGGEERGWHFSGEEDFDTGPVDGKGLGSGLGIGGNGGELGWKL